MKSKKPLNIIGTMSGTSYDGIDIARIITDGHEIIEFGETGFYPYPDYFKEKIKSLSDFRQILSFERDLTLCYADCIRRFLNDNNISSNNIDLIGFHGQTIYHNPKESTTWQLGNPSLLAANTNIDVIADFRRYDMALGGEGAPIIPIFHQAIFKDKLSYPYVILNIGGVSNITYLDHDQIIAFDTGTGCAIIDDIAKKYFKQNYDADGEIASKYQPDQELLKRLIEDPYFKLPYPKSLDRENFSSYLSDKDPGELLSTFTEFIALSIKIAIEQLPSIPKNIILTGGGRKNIFLKERILVNTNIRVENIDEYGFDGDFIEAQGMAFIAARSFLGLPYCFKTTTSATKPSYGGGLFRASK